MMAIQTDKPITQVDTLLMEIRTPTHEEVPQILALLNEHVRRGDVLPRTAVSIHETLTDWLVGVQNGQIIACVSLLHYTPVLAEVRSLAVADSVKGQGWGKAIVAQLIDLAQLRQVPTLFALTRVVGFFQKLQFSITEKENFPEKVWRDCDICPLKHNCDETAVVRHLTH